MQRKLVKVLGMDPSLSNWGLCLTQVDLQSRQIVSVDEVAVISPKEFNNKQVRKNCQDIDRARQLNNGILPYVLDAHVIFVEVPHGSKSARAMASYGICVGILACLSKPFFQVSERESKLCIFGKATASKDEMISWATTKWPDAPWARKRDGSLLGLVEHQADALAAIESGLVSAPFLESLAFLQ